MAPLHVQNSECAERTFIASVFDHGILPAGLTTENFQINYGGKNLTPKFVSYSEGPRRVMLLLDMSGSMKSAQGNATKWRVAREAASDLLRALMPGSKAALITFSTTVQTQAPLSANPSPIDDWLNSGKAMKADVVKGRTALYDAIESALNQMRPFEPGDAIYIVTDGGENASATRRSKLQEAVRESGVRLFTLMLPTDRYASPIEFADRENLTALSNESGGFVRWLDTGIGVLAFDERLRQELRVQAAQLSLQISGFYALAVNFSENPPKNKRWEVTLLESGKHKKDAWVGYPHEVPPCQVRAAEK